MEALNKVLPPHWSHNNPIDIIGDAGPDRYEAAVKIAAQDPNADGLLVIMTPQAMSDPVEIAKKLVPFAKLPGKPILALVGGASTVDLKLLAEALDEKKVHLPTEREAEQLTGLQAGGISPLALIHKGFQVVIDSQAQHYDEIHISGGQRGLNIRLPVADLARLTAARFAPVSRAGGAPDG